jgi:hypothetical protein
MSHDYLTYCSNLLGQLPSSELDKFLRMHPSGIEPTNEQVRPCVACLATLAAWSVSVTIPGEQLVAAQEQTLVYVYFVVSLIPYFSASAPSMFP